MASGVSPDNGQFIFALPEVQHGFTLKTRTFWGAQGLPAASGTKLGSASITVHMDDQGQVVSGTVLLIGAVPSLHIPDKSLLIEGHVVDVIVEGVKGQYRFSWLYRLSRSHPSLKYSSPLGVWDGQVIGATLPAMTDLFKQDWGPASAPLNTYVGQVKCLF